jgi:hypothetical protein
LSGPGGRALCGGISALPRDRSEGTFINVLINVLPHMAHISLPDQAMHAALVALLTLLLSLASSPSSAQFFSFFQNPVTLDNLDGNYRTLASCAYQHLARRLNGLSRTEPQRGVIRIASSNEQWELSFVNDEGGRQTQLVWTAGGYPREFVLSTIRACAA